jgi:hypothetical protein
MAERPPRESAQEFIKRRLEPIDENPYVTAKDVLQTGKHRYRIEARTWLVQSTNPRKVHTIERLRWLEFKSKSGDEPRRPHAPDERSYRIGYWVVNGAGEWQWGQYSLISPVEDLDALLEKARDEGTLL